MESLIYIAFHAQNIYKLYVDWTWICKNLLFMQNGKISFSHPTEEFNVGRCLPLLLLQAKNMVIRNNCGHWRFRDRLKPLILYSKTLCLYTVLCAWGISIEFGSCELYTEFILVRLFTIFIIPLPDRSV